MTVIHAHVQKACGSVPAEHVSPIATSANVVHYLPPMNFARMAAYPMPSACERLKTNVVGESGHANRASVPKVSNSKEIAMSVAARMVHGSVVIENARLRNAETARHRTKTVIAARVKVGNGSVQNSFVTTLAHRMSAGLWNQWLNSAMMGAPVDRHVCVMMQTSVNGPQRAASPLHVSMVQLARIDATSVSVLMAIGHAQTALAQPNSVEKMLNVRHT